MVSKGSSSSGRTRNSSSAVSSFAIFLPFRGLCGFIRQGLGISSSSQWRALLGVGLVTLLGGCGTPSGTQLVARARQAYGRLTGYREQAQVSFLPADTGAVRSEVWYRRGWGSRALITFPTEQQLYIYRTSHALYLVNPTDHTVISSGAQRLPVEAASLGSLLSEIPRDAKLAYLGTANWHGLLLERVSAVAPAWRGEIDLAASDGLPRMLILRDSSGEPVLRQEVVALHLNPALSRQMFRFKRPSGYRWHVAPRAEPVDSPESGY